jgi:hypothetical protein
MPGGPKFCFKRTNLRERPRPWCSGAWIAPLVESTYGVASVLNCGSSTSILSTTGVHQGDPLGSLLFSITLQPVVEQLNEVKGLVQNSWFLDDGELVGSREALAEAWDILGREGVPRGPHLSRVKSLVYCPDHDQDPLGRGVTRVEARGIKLLGAPVGEQEYEAKILEKRLISIQQLLDSLYLLDDPHMEYILLPSCFSLPKFDYNLRTVDTSGHHGVL